MKISSLANYAVGVTVAAALLAGCSTSGNSGTNPTMGTQSRATSSHPLSYNGKYIASAILPQVRPVQIPVQPDHHKKKPNQIITNFYGSDALVFNYPKSNSSTGTLTGMTDPQGECTKNGKGTYWMVSSGSDQVLEYKYGGTSPIATLSITAGEPAGCSVNSKTGDLAVSILGAGDVVIFAGGKGSGTTVSDSPITSTYFIGYDNAGDLFVDGFINSSIGFAEMKAGGSSFSSVSLPNSIEFPGQVQWDGTYITLNDQSAHAIYGYTVSGGSATLKQTVSLSGTSDCVQTWIAKKLVFCPDAGNENATVFKYPAGGSAIATLSGSFDLPIGAVSVVK
ncbi:MAG TPA: hypothetical protein VHS56_02055 [Candidatus Cybelea sp.]|nr:hypothetical protein [Candidatus Cybelea sp.]